MTWYDWLAYISGGLFWATVGVVWLGWRQHNKEMAQAMAGIDLRDYGPEDDIPEDEIPWAWVVDKDGIGQPMRVPVDMLGEAIERLNKETLAEKQRMAAEQWRFEVDANGIRRAMWIAQQQPDIEMALLEWVSHLNLPDDGVNA